MPSGNVAPTRERAWDSSPSPQYRPAKDAIVAVTGVLVDKVLPDDKRGSVKQMQPWFRDCFGLVLCVSATIFEARKEDMVDEADEQNYATLDALHPAYLHKLVNGYLKKHPSQPVGKLARRTLQGILVAQSLNKNEWKMVPNNIINALWPRR